MFTKRLPCAEALVDVRVLPAKNGPVGTHADNILVVRADLQTGDAAAVANANTSHFPLVIIPDLHKVIVTSCGGEKKGRRGPE